MPMLPRPRGNGLSQRGGAAIVAAEGGKKAAELGQVHLGHHGFDPQQAGGGHREGGDPDCR